MLDGQCEQVMGESDTVCTVPGIAAYTLWLLPWPDHALCYSQCSVDSCLQNMLYIEH